MSNPDPPIHERELKLARQVLQGFLPDRRPEIAGYEFFDFYRPASPIGGDYFDYIPLPNGRLAVVVADVVGQGVAAALLMAKLSAETRLAVYSESSPAATVTRLNSLLYASDVPRFVTMIVLVLDPVSHRATLVSAGHMPPLHRRADGRIEEPGAALTGLPLGVIDCAQYDDCDIEICSGDLLTLFTNGISMALDASGARYTAQRLREQVHRIGRAPGELGLALATDVRRFVGDTSLDDDLCLVCFGRLPAKI